MTFAEAMSFSLKDKKVTQVKLAKDLEISRVAVNRYAKGKVLPQIDLAIKISKALGFSLDAL